MWVLPDLQQAARHLGAGTAGAQPFALWLTWLCAAAVAGCALWAWWVASVVVAEALTGRVRSGGVVGVPHWGRRLVLGACGALAVGSLVPVAAGAAVPLDRPAHHAPAQSTEAADDSLLDGLPLPDRAEGPSAAEVVARALAARDRATAAPPATPEPPAPSLPTAPSSAPRPSPVPAPDTAPDATPATPEPARPAHRPAGQARRHVVVSGESLWSIAQDALAEATGAAPSAAQVAAYWPVLHAVNRDLVGPEPDLIRPGQPLRIPPPPHGEDAR